MKIEIEKEEILFDEFYKVKKGILKHEKFDGTMSGSLRRYSFEKNNGVAAIIFHTERKEILLVNQFRYPPMAHDANIAWVTELVAGGLNPDEDPEAAMIREMEEEVGYRASKIKLIHDCYVSPGVFTEKMKIFYAEISEETKVNNGGGLIDEDEDIELVWWSLEKAKNELENGKINDAKTIIGLYYLFLTFI